MSAMPWVKADLDDEELNRAVEQYQQENDCSKPEAVESLVRVGSEYLQLIE